METSKKEKVAIIGSGLIGKSWAMVFTSAGYSVSLYDVKPELVQAALQSIREQLNSYERFGQLRGKLNARQQFELIRAGSSLSDCIQGAIHVQECVPEVLDLKQQVFEELDAIVGEHTILASSTSAIPCSKFTEHLKNRSRCTVAHPNNPPYLLPLVELCPAPWTAPDVTEKTKELMTSLGQTPIVIGKEIPGFLQPRIQSAVIQEAIRLVLDDVISVEDVDKVMTCGLGLRYAFMGPLETCHLNAEGFQNFCDRYQDMIYNVTNDLGPPVPMDPNSDAMKKIHRSLCESIPMETVERRRRWRDEAVARLVAVKRGDNGVGKATE